ncbi:MAG: dihydropteroate synthase [Candidatus Cloacimonetes bacterium]|nr:dihydropteroate synthase [Candidatus Cloacimonadota bacterium]
MNRILYIADIDQAFHELKKISVSTGGLAVMAPKAIGMTVKLTKVRTGAANILKQEMLSLGADAAVARGVVEGSVTTSDVILLGNVSVLRKLVEKIGRQKIFGLDAIREDLEQFCRIMLQEIPQQLVCGEKTISFDRIQIMGILNVTPDSFSDGGLYEKHDKACERAWAMCKEGADIIDIGGESTRPGAESVPAALEMERVIPVIEKLHDELPVPISIDTCKAVVAEEAVKAGASLVNDTSALRFDDHMIEIIRDYKVPVVLMHMQGTPRNMQKNPCYADVVEEIMNFFSDRIAFCEHNGVEKSRILIDPGIGFGKRHQDNLEILSKLGEFRSFGLPVLVGASRKSFLSRINKAEPGDRLAGSLAATAIAHNNAIQLIRVHDVKEHRQFLNVLEAVRGFHGFSDT